MFQFWCLVRKQAGTCVWWEDDNFKLLCINKKLIVKENFWSKAWKWDKYFHFLFWKSILNPLDQMRNILLKKFFDQRHGKGIYNSIFCLENSISCFENQFWTPWFIWKTFYKRSFLIGGLEIGEIIPFPVWIIQFHVGIIPFPVLKINYELLGENERHFVK